MKVDVFYRPALLFIMIFFLPCCLLAALDQENSVIEGIFYDQEKPLVVIGGTLYYSGDSICGGKIVDISHDSVTIVVDQVSKEYRLGNAPCRSAGDPDAAGSDEIKPEREYLDGTNLLIKDFTLKHNENKALFESKRSKRVLMAVSSDMIESVKVYRKQLAAVPAPANCDRYYLLAVKMLDIAEDAWRCSREGEQEQALLLFDRTSRINQEISAESVRLIGHSW